VDLEQAHEMISELKTYPLLAGYRGGPRYDIDALAKAVVEIAAFASQHRTELATIEINPLVVRAASAGVVALDAVIQKRHA
jgi:hypothetical protein